MCMSNSVSRIKGETRLRVFENRVLRKMFVPKKDKVTGGCRNRIIRSLLAARLIKIVLGDQIKNYEMRGTCSTYGKTRGE
jgi:hypothetical protein